MEGGWWLWSVLSTDILFTSETPGSLCLHRIRPSFPNALFTPLPFPGAFPCPQTLSNAKSNDSKKKKGKNRKTTYPLQPPTGQNPLRCRPHTAPIPLQIPLNIPPAELWEHLTNLFYRFRARRIAVRRSGGCGRDIEVIVE